MFLKNLLLLTLACAMNCHNANRQESEQYENLQKQLMGLWGGLEKTNQFGKSNQILFTILKNRNHTVVSCMVTVF